MGRIMLHRRRTRMAFPSIWQTASRQSGVALRPSPKFHLSDPIWASESGTMNLANWHSANAKVPIESDSDRWRMCEVCEQQKSWKIKKRIESS